jgi:putative exosortase-associated protein (TIGR04073 family)
MHSFLASPNADAVDFQSFRMKTRIALFALALALIAGTAQADIQSPPGHHNNWSRKLSRGVSNILFAFMEPANVWKRSVEDEGSTAAATDFLIEGIKRTVVRVGYGAYEVATFPVPSWKQSYRSPYYRKAKSDAWWGYTEFSPQFGAAAEASYSRSQGW